MLSFGEDWVLGLSRDLESIDGPARVEGAMDREAAAVCRSRTGRAIDAIFLRTCRRVKSRVHGRMQGGLGVVATARSKSGPGSKSRERQEFGGCHYEVAEAKPTWSSQFRKYPSTFYNRQLCDWSEDSAVYAWCTGHQPPRGLHHLYLVSTRTDSF